MTVLVYHNHNGSESEIEHKRISRLMPPKKVAKILLKAARDAGIDIGCFTKFTFKNGQRSNKSILHVYDLRNRPRFNKGRLIIYNTGIFWW